MKKILLINQDTIDRDLYTLLLQENGFTVQSADDGLQGISKIERFSPDLIICDVTLSGMDGYEVLRHINNPVNPKLIPFILTSSFQHDASSIRHGMELGADDFLVKPFSAEELIKSIEARLKRFESISRAKFPREQRSARATARIRKNKAKKWVLIKGQHLEFINTEKIMYISADRDYTNVVMEDCRKHLVCRLIKEWESILPGDSFVRIHRSTIVNLEYVKKIEKWFNNTYKVYLKNQEEPLDLSRRFVHKVRSEFLMTWK